MMASSKYTQQAQTEAAEIVASYKSAFHKVRALAKQALYVEGYKSLRTLMHIDGEYIAVVDVAYEGQRRVALGSSVKQVIAWFVERRAADLLEEEIFNAG